MALIQHLGAQGDSLSEKISDVAAVLPVELRELLQGLAGERPPNDTDGPEASVECAFQCGRAIEWIKNLARNRAVDDLIYIDADGNSLMDPERADLDNLSRFRVARDRLLRSAADFSLKVMFLVVLLLFLGLLAGVI